VISFTLAFTSSEKRLHRDVIVRARKEAWQRMADEQMQARQNRLDK
jgi:hypothetical protein